MKKSTFKSLFLATISAIVLASVVKAEERVVAMVNGVPVLESQVQANIGKSGDRQVALDKVIDDILLHQAMQDVKAPSIDPKALNAAVEQQLNHIAAANNLTLGQFAIALSNEGSSLNEFRQRIAKDVKKAWENQLQTMTRDAIRNKAIHESLDVEQARSEAWALGQKMLEEAKEKGSAQKITGKEYEVRHILLKLNPMLNDEQAKAELTKIRSDILAGKISFSDAALKYSKDYLSGANGGSLGYAFPETYAPQFAQTIVQSKQGVISAPFKTEFGWHILEVTGMRDGDLTAEAYAQKAYEHLVNSQLQDATKDWVKALRKKADIQYFNK